LIYLNTQKHLNLRIELDQKTIVAVQMTELTLNL